MSGIGGQRYYPDSSLGLVSVSRGHLFCAQRQDSSKVWETWKENKIKNIKPTANFLFSHAQAIMSLRGGGGQMGTGCGPAEGDTHSMPRKEPRTRRWHHCGTGNSYKRPNSELKVDVERMH